MQITDHVYSTHIEEDPNTFGAMHPGGTQIYFVGDPSESMVMIDSGEPYRFWTRQIMDYWNELGSPRIDAILITHGHGDHTGGLDRLQEAFDCPVRCHPKLAPRLQHTLGGVSVNALRANETITTGGGVTLRPLFTPGHEDDHVCYFLRPDRVLFSGDNLLGNSSSSVRNLKQYLTSLGRMARTRPVVVCPGHGNTIIRGQQRIQQQIAHRISREDQVLAALSAGASTVDEIVSAVYPRNLRRTLRAAAGRNVRTHLEKLRQENRVIEHEASYMLPD
ncbi:Endoribonuclease LACTB2 [Geodia barretti]|uniref:Endoribonuclease LACTB2 n=1 Tax=Geodia barretti TaxID=519541 RepID=A0AA35TK97_GEOBA|nr:Endoribonuclease LACTB2 [Geodia barretti]